MAYTTRNPSNKLRPRIIESLVAPHLHAEGEHKINFINETIEMLASTSPVLKDQHRIIMERNAARSFVAGSKRADPHALVISDNQWRTWRDIRGLFLAMRFAHERRAAVSSTAPAVPARAA